MAKIKSWFDCDLQKAVQVQALNGNVFSMDNNGNQICVRIFDGGEKAVISATVTARCILADGSTVNLNGSLTSVNSQSVAVVDIPQSVLLIPGTLKISVQLTASSVVATIAAIITTVYATKTDNVITPSSQVISDWNAEISSQLASAVKFSSQSLTDAQKEQARTNIGAASAAALTEETTNRTAADAELKSALSQMADIPDAVRAKNMTEGAQYASDYTYEGVTVHAVPYSGFKLTGSLASGATCYLCHGVIPFEYGKYYTFIVLTNDTTSKINFGFRSTSPSQWVQDTDNVSIRTLKRNEAYTFTPKQTFETCYIAILNNTASTVTLDDTYYVYVVEGQYTTEQLSVARDLLTQAGNVSYNESQFVNKKVDAINANTWQSLDYADAIVQENGCYMDSTGAVVFAPEHCLLKLPNAGGICRIRLVLKASTSAPLFVVKDKNGVTKNVFARSSWGSSYLNTTLYMVFPGGLAEGATIYMNWFRRNTPGHTADFVDHIDILYEKKIIGQPNGKDLFDPAEALAMGTMTFYYETGLQEPSSTYCAGECRIKAGNIFRTYMNCHIAYYDEYGAYIPATDLSTGSTYHTYTAPAGTNGAMISCRVADVSIFSVDRDEMHFTVPINQSIIKTGVNSSSAVDNESSMVDVNAVLKLPRQYTFDGESVPIIAIIHGSGFGVSATEWGSSPDGVITASTDFDNLINLFTQSGYAVCDINGYDNSVPNNTWGSQRGVMAYRKLLDYVLAKYNVQKMVNVYGFSMGGLVALNFLNMNADIVKCAAITSPVVALYDQVFNGGSTNWKNQMMTSYGFDGTSWEDNVELTVGYDPFTRVITIDNKKYNLSDYPFMRIWHGTADTATSPTKSAELVEFIRNSCKDCTYRAVTNAGHSICWGGNSMCNNEYVYWFDRFNKKG